MSSASCRSLVERRIFERFTWAAGRLRRPRRENAETKYATYAAQRQKENHDRFSGDPPPPHPTRLYVMLTAPSSLCPHHNFAIYKILSRAASCKVVFLQYLTSTALLLFRIAVSYISIGQN